MKQFKIICLLLFLTCRTTVGQTFQTTAPAEYSDTFSRFNLGPFIYYLEDSDNHLDLKKISRATNFIRANTDVLNFGITKKAIWLKATIHNTTRSTDFIIEIKYPSLDQVELYEIRKDSVVALGLAGKFLPFKSRQLTSENYDFHVSIPQSGTKTFYLRISSKSEIILPVYFGSDQSNYQSQSNENLIYGLYFGVILVMIIYNGFLFLSVQDTNYLYYSAYILFVGLSQAMLAGYAFRFLWPSWPWMARESTIIIPALNGIAVVEFFKAFLNTKTNIPKQHKVLTFINLTYTLILAAGLFGFMRESLFLLNLVALLGSISLIWFCALTIRAGYRPARFFMIAWSFFFVSIIIFILRNFNILPFNFFTDHILLFGSGTEVTLLSLALADRINILKKEKEASQALALSESQRNEQLIKDQNLTLENKVNQRTMQLRMTMDELNLTMDDLKNTQAQLVDSEKMASLGQLTAGIAHEINNPINFVTSNINPLKRDIYDIYKLLDTYEAQMPQMDADFIKGIEKLKNELDIDYVKSEIDLLLKGIDEGANRTSEIIRGLKKFARVDEQDIKEVNLNDGFESTLLLLNSKLKDHVQVNLKLGELPKIECFAGKLNQVFMNIISNSIYALQKKFGEGPGAELDITTFIEPESDLVHIEIRDNGTGMPEEIRARIFDPFFTTKPVGEGTGLGLSIVQKIITAHKGSIEVFSTPGEGTHFKIALPVRQ